MKFKIYQSITDAGDSYNIGALGAIMNEVFSPLQRSGHQLSSDYITAMQGYIPGVPAGDIHYAQNCKTTS